MPRAPRPAGLVLAAGLSSRMEEGFKLLLPWGDGTVVGAAVRAALEAGLEPVIVVTGHRAAEVEGALEEEGLLSSGASGAPGASGDGPGGRVTAVRNPDYRRGQGTSLARGVRALEAAGVPGVAVLLGDEPGVRPDDVRSVVEAWQEEPGAVARARYADRPGHPVVFPAERFAALRALEDAEDDRGGRVCLRRLEREGRAVREVRLPHEGPADVDTRRDYERARREGN